jgi:hypothetical protein
MEFTLHLLLLLAMELPSTFCPGAEKDTESGGGTQEQESEPNPSNGPN